MTAVLQSPEGWDDRTRLLLGDEAMERLRRARVFVAGVGGVGGYAAETLARSGVGHLTLVDADCVAPSNLNRQLIATVPDLGRPKVQLFAERFAAVNPSMSVTALQEFITPDNIGPLLAEGYDYVVDAIDTVAPKVSMIACCMRGRVKIVSSMGAGGRLDPSKVCCCDLWETREDGLARAVRVRLKRMGLRRPLHVVASTEAPRKSAVIRLDERNKRSSYGTSMAVPAVFGICMANKVVLDLTK